MQQNKKLSSGVQSWVVVDQFGTRFYETAHYHNAASYANTHTTPKHILKVVSFIAR